MHAARAGAKFFELSSTYHAFIPAMFGAPICGISRSIRVMAGDARLKDFLAARRRIRRSHSASGETHSADQDEKEEKRGDFVERVFELSACLFATRLLKSRILAAHKFQNKQNLH